MANKTFSVRHGLDVANTIVIDSSRNLSNIATANATTVNATNFVTTDGLNLPNHTNNAYAAANTAANTVRVSQNSGSTLSAKQLNFVNSTSVLINVTDSGDGNANIQFSASGASPADAYQQANNARDQANTARTTANDAYGQANSALTVGQNSYEQANTARTTANDAYGAANAAQTNISNAYNQANSARDQANTAYGEANLKLNLSGGTLTGNLNVAATLITQNIIPDVNVTYSIGTATNRFKDLWLSNSTIYLGDAALSAAGDEMRANTFNASVSFLSAGLNVLDQANTARNTANDSYGQANSARDQANTARGTANDSYGQANSARDQANTARVTANDAYGQANSALTVGQNSYTQANSARDQANTARDTANDAYAAANTSGTNVLNAYAQANTARDTANDAYGAANTAQTTAQNAYGQANSALTVGQNAYGQANTARDTANDAYSQANTARDTANGAYTQANNAYAQANTANSNALAAYGQANLAYTQANAAYDQANTARDTANGAYSQANGAYAQANGAYGQANGAYAQANGSYAQANAAANTVAVFANNTVVLAQANVNFNNSATVNVSVTPNVTTGRANIEFSINSESSGITSAYNQANSARDQANTARDTANGAYAQANGAYGQANGAYAQANGAYAHANIVYGQANAAYGQANTARGTANDAYGQANSARDQANTARTQANSAYAEANLKLNLTGGTLSGDLTVAGNLTVTGSNTLINVSNLSVNDSIILMANGQVGDVYDIGFVGHFDRGATNTHAGFIRKASLNEFYLFDNYEVEPTNNIIDINGQNFRLGNVRVNTINANSVLILGNAAATQANLTLAHNQANTARDQANSARDQANTARTTANDAYAEANTAETIALNAYGQANNARDQANTARGQANTARDTANGAYAQANGAYAQANGAYGQANGAYSQANTAANTVAVYANDAVVLTKANVNFNNSATVNVSVTSNTSTGRANIEFTVNTTSSGILAANTNAVNAYGQANAARDQANTARTTANDAYGQANTALDQANTARTQANSAFDAANNRVLKAGDTMTGNLTMSGATINTLIANITTVITGNTLTLSTGTASNGNVVITANGTEYLRVTNTGNVGIRTTTPTAALEVGNSSFNGGHSISWGQSKRYEREIGVTRLSPNLVYFAWNTTGSSQPADEESFTANLAPGYANTFISTFRECGVTRNLANFSLSTDNYTTEVYGYLFVETANTYYFNTNSDDASDLYIDGKRVADYYGAHGALNVGNKGSMYLNRGFHKFYARFREVNGGDELTTQWSTDGVTYTNIPATNFFHDPYDSILSLNTGGVVFPAGNVGIRTTNPTSNLHVVGNANITLGINTATVNATTINAQSFITSTGVNVYSTVLTAYDQANAARDQANTARTTANDAYGTANTSSTNALNAYAQANAARGQANTAYGQANDAYTAANTRVLKAGDTMTGQLNISSGGLLVTGNANFDSGTLFVDSINNRVGVGGLTAPSATFDVIGGIQSNTAVFTAASQIRLKTASTTSGYGVIHRHDGSDYYTLITNNNDADGAWNGLRPFSIQLSSGNMYLGNSTLTVLHGATTSSGNVGVGTITPAYKLDVSGQARATTSFLVGSGAGTQAGDDNLIRPTATNAFLNVKGGAGRAKLVLGNDGVVISSGTTDQIAFYTNAAATTTGTERMRIDLNGNVSIGSTSTAYKLEVNGSFAATTKSFVIDHPTKPGMKLRYGSLEGPENGVYVRGKLTGNIIELPDYWPDLVDSESITVNLTPIGKHQKLFVEKIENNKVYVATDEWFGKINCYYTVFAERKDVDKLQTEYEG